MAGLLQGTRSYDSDAAITAQRDAVLNGQQREEFGDGGPSGADIAEAAYNMDAAASGLYQTFQRFFSDTDPDYRVSDDWETLVKGIPETKHRALLGATSREHAFEIRQNLLDDLRHEQVLSEAGGAGVAARLTAAVLDPVNLLASFVLPGAGAIKGGALVRLVKGGTSAAAINVGIEGYLNEVRPGREATDLWTAGLLGLGLGGLGGLAAKDAGRELTDAALRAADDLNGTAIFRDAGVDAATPVDTIRQRSINNQFAAAQKAQAEAIARGARDRAERAREAFIKEARLADDVPLSDEEARMVQELIQGEPTNRKARRAQLMSKPEVQANARLKATADEYFQSLEASERAAREAAWDAAERAKATLRAAEEEAARAHAATIKDKVEADKATAPWKEEESPFLPGSVGSAQALHIERDPAKWSIARIDSYAEAMKAPIAALRGIVSRVMDNPMGGEGGTQRITAERHAMAIHKSHYGTAGVDMGNLYRDYLKSKNIGYWRGRLQPSISRDFYERVTRAMRGNVAETDKYVLQAAAVLRKMNQSLVAEIERAGVKGADTIKMLDNYAMRRYDHDRITWLSGKFDDDELHKVVRAAFEAAPRERVLPPEFIDAMAASYLKTIKSLRYNLLHHAVPESGLDYDLIRKVVLKHSDGDEQVADEVMAAITGLTKEVAADAQSNIPARLKHRVNIDEHASAVIRNRQGVLEEVRMDDFFVNDARELAVIYSKQMSGLAGLAKVGFKSDHDFSEALHAAQEMAVKENADPSKWHRTVELLEFARRDMLGIPIENNPGSNVARVARTLRDYNFVMKMGQVGLAQLPDMGNMMGAYGLRAMWSKIDFATLFRPGNPAVKQIQRDVMTFVGSSADAANMHSIARNIYETDYYKGLSRAEQIGHHTRSLMTDISLMRPINVFMKQGTEGLALQRLRDLADGSWDDIPQALQVRLMDNGIDDSVWHDISKGLKKHIKLGPNGEMVSFDWRAWQRADGTSADITRVALSREVDRIVQESSFGEREWFGHDSALLKLIKQFRAFTMVAWAKQGLYALDKMDQIAAAQMLYGMFIAGLVYTSQQFANYGNDPEELAERLTAERIGKTAFARSAQSSLIPGLVDTALWLGTADPFFGHTRTSEMPSNFVTGSVSYQAISQMGRAIRGFTRQMATDDEYTKADAKAALTLVIPNTWLLRSLVHNLTSDLPEEH